MPVHMSQFSYWIYMLRCSNSCYYTGYTSNLPRRYHEHLKGSKTARYTRSFRPRGIACCWRLFGSRADAMRIEALIKKMDRPAKDRLVGKPSLLSEMLGGDEHSCPVIVPMDRKAVMQSVGRDPFPGWRKRLVVMLFTLVVGAAAVFDLPGRAWASETPKLQGDRPIHGGSARCVPFGSLQLETGYTYSAINGDREHTLGEILVRGAITGRLELRLGFNSFVWKDIGEKKEKGKDEGYAGLKLGLLKSGGGRSPLRPDLALIIGTSIPAGDPNYEENVYQPEAKSALSWDLAGWLNLGINFSYTLMSSENRRYNRYGGGASLSAYAAEVFGAFMEYYFYYPESRNGDSIHYAGGGVMLYMSEHVRIDGRAGWGRGNGKEELYIGGGAVVRFINVY